MNREKIIELINNPALLNTESQLSEIQSLAQKFPYSSVIQSLYAKALHISKDISFNDQLKIAAIVCSDRKKLYQTIHQNQLRSLISEIEEETALSTEEEITTQTSIPLTEKEEEITQETTNGEKEDLDELEKNILVEAINSSIQLDIPETIEKEEINKDNQESEEIKKTEIEKKKFSNWFSTTPSSKEKSISKEKKTVSIIDSFLHQEKKEIKPSEFFTPGNLAKISLVDNEEFVTETLASVYAAQGNLEKAIRIYERLILKNPEKSTFFASRIRFLKDKLENKKD